VISKETLGKKLAEAIIEAVHGEGGLIPLAREVWNGDPNVRLADESVEAVAAILWEADSSDMAHAARLSGSLTGFFYIAKVFDLDLPIEAQVLEDWCETISPAC
jgi:hypothetical protein